MGSQEDEGVEVLSQIQGDGGGFGEMRLGSSCMQVIM